MAGGYFDHDVVDSTNLEGSWDFDLEWTPRAALQAKGAAGISVFDAAEKQLGLKADLKNVEQPSLVIERVNRKPTENPAGVATALAIAAARFEAASIKHSNPDQRPFQGLLYTGGSQMRAGGTLRFLIALTLQISPNIAGDLVVGLPKSADSQRWDITAKVPSTGEGAPNVVNGRPMPPPLSVGLEMLRGLLLDQFELKPPTETREFTVYALKLANSKPKMKLAEDSDRAGCKPDPTAPKPFTNINTMIACKNTTRGVGAELATNGECVYRSPHSGRHCPEGGWNFLVGWTPKAILEKPPIPNPDPTAAAIGAADPNGISVCEAVERELGLKLVKQKRSVPVIVVDHVDEEPIQ